MALVTLRSAEIATLAAAMAMMGLAMTTDVHAQGLAQEQRWEQSLTSTNAYANPYADATVAVTFTGPGGQSFSSYGYWDGGSTFKLRAAFPTVGTWSWSTAASDTTDTGLHNRSGQITVNAYSGANPLYQHGMLKVSSNQRYLTYGDGTPFNWQGDTGWNASWHSTQAEWREYVDHRAAQGFNVIQIHATRSKENFTNNGPSGFKPFNTPFNSATQQPTPGFWQDMEQKVEYANQKGLAVMIVGAGYPQTNYYTDYTTRPEFARFIAGRFHGNHVIFSPSMDQTLTYENQNDNVGNWINAATQRHLVTQHVGGYSIAPAVGYHDKAYLDFDGMQSTHAAGDTPAAYNNARNWSLQLYGMANIKPVINIEAMYDGRGGDGDATITNWREKDARKLGWITRLSGSMGYTYGAGDVDPKVPGGKGGVWGWSTAAADHWRTAMQWESSDQVALMKAYFDQIDWWRLEPAHQLIRNQGAGLTAMALAKTADNDLAVAYLPDNDAILIDMTAFDQMMHAVWFHPIDGTFLPVAGSIPITGDYSFTRPSGWEDAVLKLTAAPEPTSLAAMTLGALATLRRRR